MASDNTLSRSAAPADESDTAHGFFEAVPREIRDQIYNLVSQDKEVSVRGHHKSIFLLRIRTAVPKTRLLSRQAMKEYDARPQVDNHLQISEYYADLSNFDRHSTPRAIPSLAFQTMTLHFDLLCCKETPNRATLHYGDRCLEPTTFSTTGQILHSRYASYIEYVTAHLPLLENVSINVSCSNMRCALALQLTDEPWTHIPKLSHVRLLRNSYDHTLSRDNHERLEEYYNYPELNISKSPEFFEQRRTMATWTPAAGWEADAEVTEACYREEWEFMVGRPYLLF
jgi:hypothetical protein